MPNQSTKAVPRMNMSSEEIEAVLMTIGDNVLPNDYEAMHIHTWNEGDDRLQPNDFCPLVTVEQLRRKKSSEVEAELQAKHSNTIKLIQDLLAKPNLTALQAAEFPDSLWARYFEQLYPMEQFNSTSLD